MNEIDTYQPGRELDALIAKEVFEIEVKGNAEPGYWVTVGNLKTDGFENSRWHHLPHYSTDESSAFQIVKHLTQREEPYIFEMAKPENGNWLVAFSIGLVFEGKADTPALAICRAALRAVRRDLSLPEVGL